MLFFFSQQYFAHFIYSLWPWIFLWIIQIWPLQILTGLCSLKFIRGALKTLCSSLVFLLLFLQQFQLQVLLCIVSCASKDESFSCSPASFFFGNAHVVAVQTSQLLVISWLVIGSLCLSLNGISEDHLYQVLLDLAGIHSHLTCNRYGNKFKYRQTQKLAGVGTSNRCLPERLSSPWSIWKQTRNWLGP